MLIFVIEYKGSEENAAWFQRRLEKVVSIAKIFQNIRLRIERKGCKECGMGKSGEKQAIRNLSDIYTDNSPVNVKENYTEYIQYWKDENDVEELYEGVCMLRCAVEWRRTRSYVQRSLRNI